MNPSFPKLGDIASVPESTYGFRTKLLYFIERIELLRRKRGCEKSEIRILDVGCGNGIQMTFPLGAQGYSVLGIDAHEPSIEYAESQNIFSNVNFLKGDVDVIASPKTEAISSSLFDVVILSDILEHIPDPEKLLRDVHSVLAPNGIMLISIPNGLGPFEVENFILRKTGALAFGRRLLKKGSDIPYNHESGHIQFFSKSRFSAILKSAGFSVSDFRKGCFLGGAGSNFIISRIPWLLRANIRVGRLLPYFLCSVWYFEGRKNV